MRLVIQRVKGSSVTIDGKVGADMQCALINDGPVTIVIDSRIKE